MLIQAIPVIAAVIAAFIIFIVVVGGVSIWTNLPDKRLPR